MVAGVVMVCFSLSTNNGPRSDVCAVTVACAPGGFESIVTFWYGPWTSVAHPLRTASASAEKVTCRVIGPPFRAGEAPDRRRHHPGSRGRADTHAAAAGSTWSRYLVLPSTDSLKVFATEKPTFFLAGILIGSPVWGFRPMRAL